MWRCALGKAKNARVSIKRSKIKGKRLFIDISSPSTISLGNKKHWLLVLKDNTNYAWSHHLKEKSE